MSRPVSTTFLTKEISNEFKIISLLIMYTVLGMFFDGLSITVLTIPVLYPLMPMLGIDVIAFGVTLMVLIGLAMIAPPVGLNLFMV